jgi:hypothetical protein
VGDWLIKARVAGFHRKTGEAGGLLDVGRNGCPTLLDQVQEGCEIVNVRETNTPVYEDGLDSLLRGLLGVETYILFGHFGKADILPGSQKVTLVE